MRRNSHFKNSAAVGDYYYSLGTISTFIVRKCFQIYPIIFKYRFLGWTSLGHFGHLSDNRFEIFDCYCLFRFSTRHFIKQSSLNILRRKSNWFLLSVLGGQSYPVFVQSYPKIRYISFLHRITTYLTLYLIIYRNIHICLTALCPYFFFCNGNFNRHVSLVKWRASDQSKCNWELARRIADFKQVGKFGDNNTRYPSQYCITNVTLPSRLETLCAKNSLLTFSLHDYVRINKNLLPLIFSVNQPSSCIL